MNEWATRPIQELINNWSGPGGLPRGATVPWSFNIIASTPVEPIGPALTVAYNPATTTLCVGGGVGVSEGKNASFGPLYPVKGTSLKNADNVLSGASLSAGYNFLNLLGVQGTGNFSGSLAGPTIGVPGAGVAATYSFCVNTEKLINLLKQYF